MRFSRLACLLVTVCAAAFVMGCGWRADEASHSSAVSQTSSGSVALAVKEIDSPAGPDSREPDLFSTHDGRTILSWVEKTSSSRYALRFAVSDGAGWSEPRTVAEGDNWFINWADFPSVVALQNGSLAAHWLVRSGQGTYAYDVNIALSQDGGKTWGKPVVPHTDGTQTEHGFVSLIPQRDAQLGAVWVDGRNLKDLKGEEDHGPLNASMTLRYATIDSQSGLSDEALLDERICECCQTSAALTSDGAIVVYRDRSDREVRDIYFVRRQEGVWSPPQPVHADGWEISACPVNGPSVSADGRRVSVAWYTEAGAEPRVQIAFSTDAGASFGTPIRVDDG
ncbi:MAG TPA: sialidase family protein, partial [Pyrinomonadaceae bacterium]|nr:sialidase family protein [Pyrinomonadaceae bacterium]